MVVHKIDKLEHYVRFLQANPNEIKALYQDMLINVTSFFRNPGVFEAMRTQVFPEIVKGRRSDHTLRIWTPACSSGEETYSVAITLLEYLGDKAAGNSIQFFGTDVSESSVARARSGAYPDNIQGDVSTCSAGLARGTSTGSGSRSNPSGRMAGRSKCCAARKCTYPG
jgi:two-component system, chemotaxis family, CheB/CheR fusion protein